jgi:PAS domain S-box-containing protein
MKTGLAAGREPGEALAGPDVRWLRLKQLVEFSPDGHLASDSQGLVVEANQAAAAMLQCPKGFLIGKPLGLFVAASNRRRFYECLARLNDAAQADEFETRVGRGSQMRDVVFRVVADHDEPDGEAVFRWLVRDITERRQADAARIELIKRLVSAQEDERKRVARELHDVVGQLMTAMGLQIRALRDAGPLPPAALENLDALQRLSHELSRATHTLAMRLRPPALDDLGLQAALRQYLEDWSARTGVAVQFQAAVPATVRFPADIETALYRVVQEALTNVARHAAAQRVSLVIQEQDGCAIVILEDNGVGFDVEAAAASGRLGLLGMRERIMLAGRILEVESAPGAGTTVIARVPLPPPKETGNAP